jgi:hypothetical protein
MTEKSPSRAVTSSGRFPVTITPDTASLKGPVRSAIELLQRAYPSTTLRVVPDTQGGAWLEMLDVPFCPPYAQGSSFVVFLLPFNLPGTDIYPFGEPAGSACGVQRHARLPAAEAFGHDRFVGSEQPAPASAS